MIIYSQIVGLYIHVCRHIIVLFILTRYIMIIYSQIVGLYIHVCRHIIVLFPVLELLYFMLAS